MSRTPSMTPIERDFMQYLWLQEDIKNLQDQASKIKKTLIEHAETHGEVDDKGHQIFGLPKSLQMDGKSYVGFMRQRRVSQVFNEDRAEELCQSKGFEEETYLSTETYVDQEKITRLYADDLLTDEEFQSLIDTNETWAFVPVKGD